ncbi:hypothetical protein [Streptomyces chrestomyceticus]|uniref:hypothetical protein n=1 Tax=Streptomyces chrestomyceticus TaxID=68185 RepID=UPI0033F6CB25
MTDTVLQNAFMALAGNDPEQICAVLTEDAEGLSQPGNDTAVGLKLSPHMVGRAAFAGFFAKHFPR